MSDTKATVTEPADGTFVVWFDRNGDPYAVYRRNDRYMAEDEDEGDCARHWYNADQHASDGEDGPYAWSKLSAELAGFDGPNELVLVARENAETPA